MSYTKQTWSTGDTVTAAKLNHMEDGIAEAGGGSSGGGAFVVNVTVQYDFDEHGYTVSSCDKNAEEIVTAVNGGSIVFAIVSNPEASPLMLQLYTFSYDNLSGSYSTNFVAVVPSGTYYALEIDTQDGETQVYFEDGSIVS